MAASQQLPALLRPQPRRGRVLPFPAQRNFAAAQTGALAASWSTSDRHVNQSLASSLRALRARSRDLERNNDYARHFLRLVTDSVAGPNGVMLQVHALRPDGGIDPADSSYLENRFASFSRADSLDVAKRLSRTAMERLIVRTVARDGEVLIRRWRGRGPFGYQLQLLDAALLDEAHNVDLPGGRKIRMGIELDEFEAPVAYHLSRRPANDPKDQGTGGWGGGGDTVRVPAEEIWHLFVPESVGQYRGVPWMSSTLIRQKRLDSYEEAALAAAEEGAKKLAWVKAPDGDMTPLADSTDSATVGSGTLYTDSVDIHYASLPAGYDLASWDPKYPENSFPAFTKSHLRGIASGLGVAYHKLASDLENVNYSSARAGELNERDVWLGLQGWLIDSFCAPLYSEWLPLAILSGALNLPMAKLPKFDAAVWQGRRWDWVDPEKDVNASILAINSRLTSRSRVIRQMGLDPEEVWAEIAAEEARFGPLNAQTANGGIANG